MKHSVVLVLLALVVTPVAGAQWLAESSSWGTSPKVVAPTQTRPMLVVEAAADYRWHGLALGFVALGALGAWIGNDACQNQPEPASSSDGGCAGSAVAVGAVGGLLGATIGFFIGKGVPQARPD